MHASPDHALTVVLAGEPVVLLGERALYWPARERLVIADLHLGKSHVFRQAGIAVPSGATQEDLRRLDGLIRLTQARAVWIVGDLLHGPAERAAWRDAWMAWRQGQGHLDVAVIAGNHDRALDAEVLGVRQLGSACADGPFLFRHAPGLDPQGRHVIAGHVHPKARVPGVSRAWPVFWMRPAETVLPAFSDFTGGWMVDVGAGDALAACVEGTVVPLVGTPG